MANRTSGNPAPTISAAFSSQGRLQATSCLARAWQDRDEPARAAPVIPQEVLVQPLTLHLIEVRVAHVRGLAPALAKPRLLERQFAEHMVDQPPHLPDSPTGPGPDLGSAVIEDGDPVGLGDAGHPPIEPRIVDEHHCVRSLLAETAPRPQEQTQKLVKVQQDPEQPHDGELRQVFVQLASCFRHPRSAVANELHIGTKRGGSRGSSSLREDPARLAYRKEDPHGPRFPPLHIGLPKHLLELGLRAYCWNEPSLSDVHTAGCILSLSPPESGFSSPRLRVSAVFLHATQRRPPVGENTAETRKAQRNGQPILAATLGCVRLRSIAIRADWDRALPS